MTIPLRRARAAGVACAALLVALAACLGSPDRNGTDIETDDGDPTFTTPPTENTDDPIDPTATTSPGGILVAGPTLDSHFPDTRWPGFVVPEVGSSLDLCDFRINVTAAVPVTVVDVTLVRLSDGPSEFSIVPPDPACAGAKLVSGVGEVQFAVGCVGRMLPPVTVEPVGCALGERYTAADAQRSFAVLRWTFEANCTSVDGVPCAGLAGKASPSPGQPVTVRWSQDDDQDRRLVGIVEGSGGTTTLTEETLTEPGG